MKDLTHQRKARLARNQEKKRMFQNADTELLHEIYEIHQNNPHSGEEHEILEEGRTHGWLYNMEQTLF